MATFNKTATESGFIPTQSNEVTVPDIRNVSATHTVSLSDDAGLVITASSSISLGHSNSVEVTYVASNTLSLDHTVEVTKVVTLSGSSSIIVGQSVGQTEEVGATHSIQTITEELDDDNQIVEVISGLDGTATVIKTSTYPVTQIVSLGQVAVATHIRADAIALTADNTIALSQSANLGVALSASSSLNLSHQAVGHLTKSVSQSLGLSQTAEVVSVNSPEADQTIPLSQSVAFILVPPAVINDPEAPDPRLCEYSPFVSGGPVPTELEGPADGVTARFALIYPAEGTATDTIEMRPPNLGNKDRLAFDRINRESRGGTLIVFADPIWPKSQTMVLNFSALHREEAMDLMRFMQDHLGEEIKLTDWEQRVWRGVITTPDSPIIADRRDSYSASFEFDGVLA